MKPITKKIILILLGVLLLFCLGIWLMACLFATGQLYDSYNLWEYILDAPVAVLIMVALLAGSIASFVAAVRVKNKK